jgi:3-isopropylmalate dehydrogenase
MYEPVHGSAPPLAGKDVANPMAAILTIAMMLTDLGFTEASSAVESAVRAAIGEGIGTADVGGKLGTRAVGEWIAERVRAS